MSYKNKIYLLGLGILALAGLLFGYVFELFDTRNEQLASKVLEKRKTVLELESEQKSFQQGKKALDELLSKPYQPTNFFASDTSLVHEIKSIELMSQEIGVTTSLSVSGTVKKATKAKTVSEVYMIPVSLRVEGGFAAVVRLLEKLEHANFPITISSLGLGSSGNGEVSASLQGNFYVKK